MTSKIDSLGAAAIGAAAAPKAAGDKAVATAVASAAAAPPVDKVSLTGDAVRMQQLDRSAAAAPAVDSSRVAAVKSAIASGSYTVNAGAVAGKLSRMEWELGGQ
jgi:negative regulator of flagellin synthesis FlgM